MDALLSKQSVQYNWALKNIVILTTVLLILAVLIFSAIYYFRYRRKPSHRPHKHSDTSPVAAPIEPADESGERIRVRKKRRERIREHRPRNPTLQETGGLPPVRPDDELPKF
jgi:hypothetical protein